MTYDEARAAKDVTVVLAIEGRMRVAATQPHRIVQWRRAGASEEETSYLFSLSEKPFSRACEPRVLRIMEPNMEDPHNNMFIFETLGERQAARRMFNPSQGTSGGPGGWRGRGGGEGWSEEEEEAEGAAARGSGSAADADSGSTSTSGGTAEAAFGPALPTVRTKAGREREEGRRAQRHQAREVARQSKEAVRRDAERKRCAQSKGFWCRCDAMGNPLCNFAARSARSLAKHIKEGKHRQGLIRPYTAGVAVGRGTANDRDVAAATQALLGVSSGGSGGAASSGASATQPAEGFRLEYVDGQQYQQPAAAIGWARAQRLPAVRSTMEQLEFVYEAWNIKTFYVQKQFSPAQVTLRPRLAPPTASRPCACAGGGPW